MYSTRIRIYVEGPEGRIAFDVNRHSFSINGRIDPVAVPLTPYARYIVEAPVRKWLAGWQLTEDFPVRSEIGASHLTDTLEMALRRPGKLWAEWDAASGETLLEPTEGGLTPVFKRCPDETPMGSRTMSGMPCWSGKLVSNTITLPN